MRRPLRSGLVDPAVRTDPGARVVQAVSDRADIRERTVTYTTRAASCTHAIGQILANLADFTTGAGLEPVTSRS